MLLSWIKQSHKQSSCTVSFKLQMNTTLTQAQQPQIARLAWCIRSTQPTESSPVGLGIPEPPTEPLPLQEWDILVEENTCSIQELQAPPTFYTRMRLFLTSLYLRDMAKPWARSGVLKGEGIPAPSGGRSVGCVDLMHQVRRLQQSPV